MAGQTVGLLKKDRRSKKKQMADFLAAFPDLASVTRTCKKVKVSRSNVYEWIKRDPAFKKAYKDACKLAIEALKDEAIRRAHEGTDKPVYQGGERVGKIREYSDTLLIFLLKGLEPETFRERFSGELTGKGGKDLIPAARKKDLSMLSDDEVRIMAEIEKKIYHVS